MENLQEKPAAKLTAKDFASDQDVKWCPGCGDYSILKQTQTTLAEIGLPTEEIVFISGIGCSSRFPYYMNTYGMHSIHGRAPAVATGLRLARPELSVWMITGDGDALSIGGNHLIHMLRRNPDINVLLFNNEIYGLTKGQYSPTSPLGKIAKSTPYGSVDEPLNPLKVALAAGGHFIARSIDRDPKHLREMMKKANAHRGASLLEIYQNCNIFNDGAFFDLTDKDKKLDTCLFLEEGQPLVYGKDRELGIKFDGLRPVICKLSDTSENDLWIHDSSDDIKASILVKFFDDPTIKGNLPRPFGVFYEKPAKVYEHAVIDQIEAVKAKMGEGDLDSLLSGAHTWTVG